MVDDFDTKIDDMKNEQDGVLEGTADVDAPASDSAAATANEVDALEGTATADAPEDADRLAQLLREKIPGLGNISTRYVGPVIGAHCGPGTVAVCFFGKERPY